MSGNLMEKFSEVNLAEAYKMLEGAPSILVCTKGKTENLYNVTPIGWFTTYDYEPVTKILFVSDPAHQCAKNIERTKEFAICIPDDKNDPIIEQCGSVSSETADKFKEFNIKGEKASKIDVMVLPENSKAIIELKLVRIIEESTVKIFMGEAVNALKKN